MVAINGAFRESETDFRERKVQITPLTTPKHKSEVKSKKLNPNLTRPLLSYMFNTIEAITDEILFRAPSIPLTIRAFLKALP